MKSSILALAALILFPGLSANALAEDKPTVIRIGYPGAGSGGRPLSSGSTLPTAHQLGALEKEFQADGIKVEWTFFPGAGPQVNEALANRKVDFSLLGDLPLIVGRATGLRHKIVFSGSRFAPSYVTVPSDSPAQSVADLKGKRFGVFKGTAQQLTLNRILEKAGLSEKDVKVIAMDTETQRTTLATKDVDATLSSPWDLQARGVARPLVEIKGDAQISSVSTVWVEEEFEKKYPQIVQRIVTALVKVAHWQAEEKNRDELFKIWARDGITPYVDWVRNLDGIRLKDYSSPLLDDYYRGRIAKAVDETKKYKLIRRDVPLDGWIEPKYLNQALKDLKLERYWTEFDADGKPKPAKLAAAQ
jgi:sulfonate transport system substrate-binding protein